MLGRSDRPRGRGGGHVQLAGYIPGSKYQHCYTLSGLDNSNFIMLSELSKLIGFPQNINIYKSN